MHRPRPPPYYLHQSIMSSSLHRLSPYLMAFLLVFSFIFFFKWFLNKAGSEKRLPPSPPKFPIIGNLHQLGIHPHRSLQSLARTYGPLMLIHLGRTPVLVISSAQAAREIMKTHDLVFSNRAKSGISEKLLYNYKDIASSPYGEYWRQMRSICVLNLLSNRRVQSFRAVREEETATMIENIRNSSSRSMPVDLSETFISLTNDVVCRIALGRKHGGDRFKETLLEMGELLGTFKVADFIPLLGWIDHVSGLNKKLDRVSKELDRFLDEVIEEHLLSVNRCDLQQTDDGKHKDFVDILLEVQKESTSGFPIDTITIKALILDMFVAGTDTTYTVLEWAMTELLRSPKSMNELQNEVRRIGRDKDMINEDDLEDMIYLKAVIKETFRMHPPLPLLVVRASTQDVQVMGYDISAGTLVMSNVWAIGRDACLWDEPDEFRPERFLNSGIDYKGQDFELLPFGAGRRGCPGIHFAIAVNELALANVVHKFDWGLEGVARAQDVDVAESSGLTIHRKFPLYARATLSTT